MTRLTLHTEASAPEGSQAFVARAVANNGFLPNLIGILANAPSALETYLTVAQINARGSLTLAEREVVQITAARLHGCDFCVAGHTAAALKQAKLGTGAVIALQNGEATGDARLDALRVFTEAVIATRGNVDDDALTAFRAAGYSEAQALDTVLGVSLATLCNFANSLARSPVNPQLQPYLPEKLQAETGRARAA
ncbi:MULTISPECIES: carboxymuconolactone decarboxylase family protein [unclassified Variovorax]|uniref:carboxymuconolactone decarboxylase family protein n=1 Tax=unclassified Variovorax TaxID=663243 RepID=UPI002575A2B8|nr:MULTISPECIES: carboxymuconolactone decarboxylase family protein [unclassified Variovorax]MDM0087194.1 carboxymuconolactone decarboxylase family protein [Variovorax sp. J22G40]MDM0144549.1 carboxymuconolactone decarboxylase family protein [Variovorax sp. J2P1-31]